MLDSKDKKILRWFILAIVNDIFKIFLISFFVLAFFEIWRPGFVVNYLNMNALLTIALASGIVSLLFNEINS